MNGDGALDLIGPTSGAVRVLLGNGDGTFQPPQNFAVNSGSGSLVVGDFNGDGLLDLVVGDEWTARVFVLLNDGIW